MGTVIDAAPLLSNRASSIRVAGDGPEAVRLLVVPPESHLFSPAVGPARIPRQSDRELERCSGPHLPLALVRGHADDRSSRPLPPASRSSRPAVPRPPPWSATERRASPSSPVTRRRWRRPSPGPRHIPRRWRATGRPHGSRTSAATRRKASYERLSENLVRDPRCSDVVNTKGVEPMPPPRRPHDDAVLGVHPSWNDASSVLPGDAIDSLLAQSHQDWELIIGDNASTDGIEDVMDRFSGTRCSDPTARQEHIDYAGNANLEPGLCRFEWLRVPLADDRFSADMPGAHGGTSRVGHRRGPAPVDGADGLRSVRRAGPTGRAHLLRFLAN